MSRIRLSVAILLVVGPSDDRYWQEGSRKADGRIRVLGRREDTALFYQAADIYLDSFPFASLTSMLEAGSYGAPLVSYCPHLEAAPVMCSDDSGLNDNLIRSKDPQSCQVALSRLIEDSHFRMRLGHKTRESIQAQHTGEGWRQSLLNMYRGPTTSSIATPTLGIMDQKRSEPLDAWLVALHTEAGMCRDTDTLLVEHAGLLPFGPRVRIWARTLNAGRKPSLGLLLPEYMRMRIRRSMDSLHW
jgi:hypothetical protein